MSADSGISVIIPALNAEPYLAEALESVRVQTLPAMEVIVVDNGSTDNTAWVAQEAGVRCESEPRRGSGYARNRGIAAAKGGFFAFLDADDLWMPRKLEWQMEALAADARFEAVFGGMGHFISPDMDPKEAAGLLCPADAAVRLSSLMLIRRDAFERVGMFATDISLGDVVEWVTRAESAGLRHVTVPHVVYKRRIHARNLSRVMRGDRGDYIRILKQKLDRERALNAKLPGKTE